MERHDVFRSDRIKVTEEMLREQDIRSVLEVGAGDYSFDYVKNREQVSWTRADFHPPCDVVCDFNDQRLALPFGDNSFDMLICTEVIEHLLWPQQLLREARRILLPHGMILLSIPNVCSLSYRIAWLLGRIPSCAASGNLPPELGSTTYRQASGDLVGGHVVDFNLPRLEALLDITGFRAVTARGSGIIWHRQLLPHWLVPVSLSSNIICLAQKKT